MIGLVMLGSIVNYLTRSTLSVAAPGVLQDLRISEQEYSWIVAAFQFAIMLQPICGYVLDLLGFNRTKISIKGVCSIRHETSLFLYHPCWDSLPGGHTLMPGAGAEAYSI